MLFRVFITTIVNLIDRFTVDKAFLKNLKYENHDNEV